MSAVQGIKVNGVSGMTHGVVSAAQGSDVDGVARMEGGVVGGAQGYTDDGACKRAGVIPMLRRRVPQVWILVFCGPSFSFHCPLFPFVFSVLISLGETKRCYLLAVWTPLPKSVRSRLRTKSGTYILQAEPHHPVLCSYFLASCLLLRPLLFFFWVDATARGRASCPADDVLVWPAVE